MAAYLNSHFQTGLKNVLGPGHPGAERGAREAPVPDYRKVDEIPFDFSRRMMSVVVDTPEGTARLIAKGAPEEIFRRCDRFELNGEVLPMEQVIIEDLKEEYQDLSDDGFRVLAVADRTSAAAGGLLQGGRVELVLLGYVAFLDPPKETAAPAIAALQQHGVSDEDPHRRQRAGQPQGLPRGGARGREDGAGERRWRR